MRRLPRGTGC